MAYINVSFLGKEYSISDQLPILVPILQCFDEYKQKLMDRLLLEMQSGDYTGGAEQDFVFWKNPISKIAKDAIKNAAAVGVYDLTEYELVENNPGYVQLREVCKQTMNGMIKALEQAIEDFANGYERAYAEAASNITGSGVSIWTSSLGSAMLYSVMEGNVLRKQAKEADRQFSNSISALSARNQSKQTQAETRVKTQVYYPGCKESINRLISYMLSVYLQKLNDNHVIDCSEIEKYDLQESQEILKNLNFIPQKAEVLGKAFERCPYNIDSLLYALDGQILDDESLKFVEWISLSRIIMDVLKDKIGEVHVDNISKKIKKIAYYIHVGAHLENINDREYLQKIAAKARKELAGEYDKYRKIVNDERKCREFADQIDSENMVHEYVELCINDIVSDGDLKCLFWIYGEDQILNDISFDTSHGGSIKEINEYYILQVSQRCIPIVKRLIMEREEAKEKDRLLNEEKKKAEEVHRTKARKKKIIHITLIAMIVIIPLTVYITHSSFRSGKELSTQGEQVERIDEKDVESRYREAQELCDNGNYRDAIMEYTILGDYKDSSAKIIEAKRIYYSSKIEAGYTTTRLAESMNIFECEKATEYHENEKAYRYIRLKDVDEDDDFDLYISVYSNGTEMRKWPIQLNKDEPYYGFDFQPVTATDSEFYVYDNSYDCNNHITENAYFHERILFVGGKVETDAPITYIPDDVKVIAGFYKYTTGEFDIEASQLVNEFTSRDNIEKVVYVSGLNDNEEIKLYIATAIETASGARTIEKRGEFIFTKEKNSYRGTWLGNWNVIYKDAGDIYVFNDYNAYLDYDFTKAIAHAHIEYRKE